MRHRDAAGQPGARAQDHGDHLQGGVVGVAARHGEVADVEVGLVLGVGLDLAAARGAPRRRRLRAADRAGRRRGGEEPRGRRRTASSSITPATEASMPCAGRRRWNSAQSAGVRPRRLSTLPCSGRLRGCGRVELLEEPPGRLDVRLVGQALELGRGLPGEPGAAVLGEGGLEQQLGRPVQRQLPVRAPGRRPRRRWLSKVP